MEQVYTRIHSNEARLAGIPHAQPAIVIGAGMQRCARLKMPHFGRLTDVMVRQKSTEVQVNFTVDVLKSKFPFVPDTDVVAGTPPADDLTLYRVIDRQTGVAGTPVEVAADGNGFPYRNMDGTYTENQRFLYVLIIPELAGTLTTWDVALTTVYDS